SIRTGFGLNNFPTSRLVAPPSSVSRSRIPVVRQVAGGTSRVGNSTNTTTAFRSFGGLPPICPMQSTASNTALLKLNNQRTTSMLSNMTITVAKPAAVESGTKKQIELDFNQSRNNRFNKSCDNSGNLSRGGDDSLL